MQDYEQDVQGGCVGCAVLGRVVEGGGACLDLEG